MGAPTAQVQSSQTSQPAGKNAGQSPSSDTTTVSLGGLSGQPGIGQPNTNGNVSVAPVNPAFVSPNDGVTQANPYPKTVGTWNNQSNQSPSGKGKGA